MSEYNLFHWQDGEGSREDKQTRQLQHWPSVLFSLCRTYSTWNVNADMDGNHVSDKPVGFRHATDEWEFAPFSHLHASFKAAWELWPHLGFLIWKPSNMIFFSWCAPHFSDKICSALQLHREFEWVEYLSDSFQSIWHFVMDINVS